MASSKHGVIRMFNGRLVDVFNLQPADVVPINFIHSLSLINRFTGASPWPVSVMQHSLKIEQYVKDQSFPYYVDMNDFKQFTNEHEARSYMREDWMQFRRACFIHDWSEALFNDLASPVKKQFPGYRDHEHRALKVIFKTLNVPYQYLDRVDPMDKQIYRDEVRSTWGIQHDTYDTDRIGLGVKYTEQPWRDVRAEAIAKYAELFSDGPYLGAVVL